MSGASGFREVRSSPPDHQQIGCCTSNSLDSEQVPDTVPVFRNLSLAILVLGALLLWLPCSWAADPITPSGLLHTEIGPPILIGPTTQYDITGGTRPGGVSGTNLFHSFGDFNVPTNNIANFLNVGSVDLNGNVLDSNLPTSNILGRVTGGDPSVIFGMIQTNGPGGFGNANLFLMNPAGFLFGPNAMVNVGGMFAFTSADYLRLADNVRFNAVPNAAADALLSTVPVVAYGFLGSNPSAITVQGSQFSVTDGQSISLIGGNISIESGTPDGGTAQPALLSAPNGRIQLASAASPGEFDATTLQALPNVDGASFTSFGSFTLASGSSLNLSGANTVSIRSGQFVLSVNDAALSTAENAPPPETISLSRGSSIVASNSGTGPGPEVQLIASDIQLDGASIQSLTTGDGAGGNILIIGQSNNLMNGAQIVSSTSGASDGGNITISATDSLSISGYDPTSTLSGVSTFISDINTGVPLVTSGVFSLTSGSRAGGSVTINAGTATFDNAGTIASIATGDGRGGDIVLNVRNLNDQNGGLILNTAGLDFTSFELKGNGRAGDITIVAEDSIQVSGFNPNTFAESVIWSWSNNTGDGGNISLSALNVSVQNGGIVQSIGSGTGNTGSISITAAQVSISGFDEVGNSSRISSMNAAGNSGTINIINAQSVNVEDTGFIQTLGNEGDITIQAAQNVNVTGVGFIQSVGGNSGSGDITISADHVLVSGKNDFSPSSIETLSNGQGDVGRINLNVRELVVTVGARINTEALSANAIGGIHISVTDSVTVSDGGKIRMVNEVGIADSIEISAQTITLNQGIIQTETTSSGNAGSVTLTADNVNLVGGFINGQVAQSLSGQGGDITINVTDTLSISGQFSGTETDSARPAGIFADTSGTLPGGNISVTAGNLISVSGPGAGLFSQSFGSSSNSGAISAQAPQIQLSDGAMISAKTTGSGNAGSVSIEGTTSPAQSVLIDGVGSGIFTDTQGTGAGGNIFVNANSVTLQNGGTLSAKTSGAEPTATGGTITVNANQVQLNNQANITATSSGAGNAGTITVTAEENIVLLGRSSIESAADGEGNGGLVSLTAPSIEMHGGSNIVTSTSGLGNAGDIELQGNQVNLTTESFVTARTEDKGHGGNITIRGLTGEGSRAIDVTLSDNSKLVSETTGDGVNIQGDAGNILVETARLNLSGGSLFNTASVFSTGAAGNITVNATDSLTISGFGTQLLSASEISFGDAGHISISAPSVVIENSGFISTSTTLVGNAGTITVNTNDLQLLSGGSITSSSLAEDPENPPSGAAGTVTIQGLASPAQSVLIDGPGSGLFTDTQGTGAGGNIFLNANSVTLQNGGTLSAATSGTVPEAIGGTITVDATQVELNGGTITASTLHHGDAGSIHINATDRIALTNLASIASESSTARFLDAHGNGGTITLHAPHIAISGKALVNSSTNGPGNAGDVVLETQSLIMSGVGTQGGRVITNTQGPGQGGNITVQGLEGPESAAEVVQLAHGSLLIAQTIGNTGEEGNAGSIHVQAATLVLDGASQLSTAAQDSAGEAGTVIVDATDSVHLSGKSSITSNSAGGSLGQAGNITITSPTIGLKGASFISTSTEFVGNAGNISIHTQALSLTEGSRLTSNSGPQLLTEFPSGAAGSVTIQNQGSPALSVLIDGPDSGIFTDTQGTGAGGDIFLNANSVTLQNGGMLSAATSGTDKTATGGTITVDATNTVTMNSASITANSAGVADAGSINITGLNGFTMQNSTVTTQAGQGAGGGDITVTTSPDATVLLQNSKISASVADGRGGGGNISIDPQFVILQNSQILAQAAQGQGGAITIFANLFLSDANSIVNADSGSGVNGTVTIQSPNAPISGQIQPLGKSPLIATSLLNQRCAALANGEFSSFTVAGRDSLPTEPGSWLASPLYAANMGTGVKAEGVKAEGERLEGMSAGAGQGARGESLSSLSGLFRASNQRNETNQINQMDQIVLSLRQIAPAGFLTQAFATDSSTGCS